VYPMIRHVLGLAGLCLSLLLLAGCRAETIDEYAALEVFAGYYRQAFEQSDFYPESGGGPYWLTADEPLWSEIQRYYVPGPGRRSAVTARVIVEGRLATGGGYGHLGAYQSELTAERLLEIEPIGTEEFDAWVARHNNDN